MPKDVDDFWEDVISDGASDAGVELTKEQQTTMASWAQSAHENYGMSHYEPPGGEYLSARVEVLEKELRKEKDKRGCPECGGRGRVEYMAGPWFCNTQCDRCNGEGKVA